MIGGCSGGMSGLPGSSAGSVPTQTVCSRFVQVQVLQQAVQPLYPECICCLTLYDVPFHLGKLGPDFFLI